MSGESQPLSMHSGLRMLVDGAARARWVTYAFMLTMPWAGVFFGDMNPHDVARIAQTVAMALAALGWAQLGSPWRPRQPAARQAVHLVLLLAVASVAMAPHAKHALLEATSLMLLAMLAAVFARTPSDTLLRELPPVVAMASALSVAMELPVMAFHLSNGQVPLARDLGFMYMNHRFLNHVQTVLLPLTLLPLLVPVARWARVAAWIGLVGGAVILWRSGGRGTLIAGCFVVAGLPWLLRERARQIVRVFVLAGVAAAASYALLFHGLPHVFGLGTGDAGSALQRIGGVNDSARVYLWQRAIADVLAHPWLGSGPMQYARTGNPYAAHPHNSALQVAAEWGVPMLLVLTALAGAGLLAGWRRVRLMTTGHHAPMSILVAVGLLTALAGGLDSLVSGTLVMPVSQTWWFVALGVAMAARPVATPGASAKATVPRASAWALVVVHGALAVATYLQATKPGTGEPVGMIPRYWGNGQFQSPPGAAGDALRHPRRPGQ